LTRLFVHRQIVENQKKNYVVKPVHQIQAWRQSEQAFSAFQQNLASHLVVPLWLQNGVC